VYLKTTALKDHFIFYPMLSNLGEPITVLGTVFCLNKLTAIKNTFLLIYLLFQVNLCDKK
jgi:hypothetical protein